MSEVSNRRALIIIDMQNDFIDSKGFLAKTGEQLGFKRDLLASVVPFVARLLSQARQLKIPIVHIYTAWNADHSDRAVPMLIPEAREAKFLIEGSWGAEIVKELTPIEGEHKILKKSYGAFFQTPLDRLLRNLQIRTVIICGIMTNVCVETTIREAVALGYEVILSSDATATVNEEWHQFSLKTIELFFGKVTSTDAIIKEMALR
jgi:ureidoacrylate peracid hydrolase